MHVFLGRQMSNGHFIRPLDISNVHWIQWAIGHYHYPLPIYVSMTPFPGGYKVRFSPLDPMDSHMSSEHLSCPLDPMDSDMSNGHFICPLDICVSIEHVWIKKSQI